MLLFFASFHMRFDTAIHAECAECHTLHRALHRAEHALILLLCGLIERFCSMPLG